MDGWIFVSNILQQTKWLFKVKCIRLIQLRGYLLHLCESLQEFVTRAWSPFQVCCGVEPKTVHLLNSCNQGYVCSKTQICSQVVLCASDCTTDEFLSCCAMTHKGSLHVLECSHECVVSQNVKKSRKTLMISMKMLYPVSRMMRD